MFLDSRQIPDAQGTGQTCAHAGFLGSSVRCGRIGFGFIAGFFCFVGLVGFLFCGFFLVGGVFNFFGRLIDTLAADAHRGLRRIAFGLGFVNLVGFVVFHLADVVRLQLGLGFDGRLRRDSANLSADMSHRHERKPDRPIAARRTR